MTSHPTLAQSAATLRAAVQSDRAPFWLPDSLHALIMACLLRIFGRLEQMIALWQSGQLPPPQPRRPSTSDSNVPLVPNAAPTRRLAPARQRGAIRAHKAIDEINRAQPRICFTAPPRARDAMRREHSHPRANISCRAGRAAARAPPRPNP